jgi:hypothetical protein
MGIYNIRLGKFIFTQIHINDSLRSIKEWLLLTETLHATIMQMNDDRLQFG